MSDAEFGESEMSEDNRLKAEKQYHELHSSDGAEEGESEMALESGEYEWEDVEEELSESEDEPPELVPIEEDRDTDRKPAKKRSKSVPVPTKEFESDFSSESDVEEEEDVDEMSSDALDEAIQAFEHSSEEQDNEHGFVYAHNLNTYKLNKKERIEALQQEREENKGGRKDY